MLNDEMEYRERLNLIKNRKNVSSETLISVGQMYLTELNDFQNAYEILPSVAP